MNQMRVLHKTLGKIILFSSFIFTLSLMLGLEAIAENQAQNKLLVSQVQTKKPVAKRNIRGIYKEPPKPSAPRNTTNTSIRGIRGECNVINLAPYSYVGYSKSTHPTFAFYVQHDSNDSYPLEFNLYADGRDKPIYSTTISSKQGMMYLSLPKTKPGLIAKQRYFWEITMECSSVFPSKNPVDRVDFEVLEASPNLSSQINLINDPFKRVEIYGSASFWYDAFAETFKLHQKDEFTREFQLSLIHDLADSETNQGRKIRLLEILNRIEN
jgi:Domain of Unknown Function (DUF928)